MLVRRAIFAAFLLASLLLGSLAAFAQAPPAVPALPDTERRTSYSISGTTCACAVNFAIYGDSTDVDEWIEVWINGTKYLSTDATFGWALTSATGPIASIPRPITDAILTFNNAQTGTVQIVGARRPRRPNQFTEGRGVAARDLNQAITDIVAQNRETWDKINDVTGRALIGQPGDSFGTLPPISIRANNALCFTSGGAPLACSLGLFGGITSIIIGTTPITGGTANNILVQSTNVVGEIAQCNNGLYLTNGSGVPSCGVTLANTLTLNPAANAAGLVISGYAMTGNASANALDISGSSSSSGTTIGTNININFTGCTGTCDLLRLQNNGANALEVQSNGQFIFDSSASFSANGSVATVLGSLGPVGSHTTVQTWLTFVDSTGATRYVPAF